MKQIQFEERKTFSKKKNYLTGSILSEEVHFKPHKLLGDLHFLVGILVGSLVGIPLGILLLDAMVLTKVVLGLVGVSVSGVVGGLGLD